VPLTLLAAYRRALRRCRPAIKDASFFGRHLMLAIALAARFGDLELHVGLPDRDLLGSPAVGPAAYFVTLDAPPTKNEP
jgi:hypothetical protein